MLQSPADADRFYVGLSGDPFRRLEEHNGGGSRHTAKWRPWRLDPSKAVAFERYLKSGSGRAFAKRHF